MARTGFEVAAETRSRARSSIGRQVHQVDLEVGDLLEQSQRVVAGPAADVQDPCRAGRARGGGLGDQLEDERRVDGRRLSDLEAGEPLDVAVEAGADLVDGRRRHPGYRFGDDTRIM
ncbi:hypothetical protein [Rubrivirga sp.]|uniref:hypothetical protein n=1 Tax=Rubrivirga sp. TaxID=1885344 RepID=UPI003C778B7F